MDLNANFGDDKRVLTSYGGHFQQLYYVVSAIYDMYGDDLEDFFHRKGTNPTDENSKKPLTARELLVEQFFLPFLVQYMRDNKMEAFTFMANS